MGRIFLREVDQEKADPAEVETKEKPPVEAVGLVFVLSVDVELTVTSWGEIHGHILVRKRDLRRIILE